MYRITRKNKLLVITDHTDLPTAEVDMTADLLNYKIPANSN